ncbi:MAG: cytochrome c [Cyanobacteria bacterium P01_A01_bin.114]
MTPETLKTPKADETAPVITLRKLAVIVIGLVLAMGLSMWGLRYVQASEPYIHEVLSLKGDSSRGREIFKLNCATCHGLEADGEVGPTLHRVSDHKSRVGLINQVISGKTPPMPQFQPSAKDMADLLSFLETL